MTRVAKWRELGRPEASLLGVQYIANDMGEHRGPWLLRKAPATSWLFVGDGLRGRQAPSRTQGSRSITPPRARLAERRSSAEIPNLLGPGLTAQMTYYATPRGAKVFSAGAFTLAGSIRQKPVAQLVENIWAEIAGAREETRHPVDARVTARPRGAEEALRGRIRCLGYHGTRMRPRIATLSGVLLVLLSSLAVPAAEAASSAKPLRVDRTAPRLLGLRAYTLSPQRYAGDRRLLVTISPNGDHVRDMAKIGFTLTERATVHLRIARTLSSPETVYEVTATFGPGRHAFNWFPEPDDRAANVSDPARRHGRGEQPAHVRREQRRDRSAADDARDPGARRGRRLHPRELRSRRDRHAQGRDRRPRAVAAGVPCRAGGRPDLQRHADERRAGDGSGQRRVVEPRPAGNDPRPDRRLAVGRLLREAHRRRRPHRLRALRPPPRPARRRRASP